MILRHNSWFRRPLPAIGLDWPRFLSLVVNKDGMNRNVHAKAVFGFRYCCNGNHTPDLRVDALFVGIVQGNGGLRGDMATSDQAGVLVPEYLEDLE